MAETEKRVITLSEKKKYEARLEELKNVKAPEIEERIKVAKEQGDLSENAEYTAANEEQAKLIQEIAEIESLLKNAELVDESTIDYTKVNVGTTVVLKFKGERSNRTIQIVGSLDLDSRQGRISSASPLGKAIEGKEAGDNVEFMAPKGKVSCKIISVSKTESDN